MLKLITFMKAKAIYIIRNSAEVFALSSRNLFEKQSVFVV